MSIYADGVGGISDWLKKSGMDVLESGKTALQAKISEIGKVSTRQPTPTSPTFFMPSAPAAPMPVPGMSPAMKYGLAGVSVLLVAGMVMAFARKR